MKNNAFELNFTQANDGQFVVIADFPNSEVIVGGRDKTTFADIEDAVEVKDYFNKHLPKYEAKIYLVQLGMDEYGQTKYDLVKVDNEPLKVNGKVEDDVLVVNGKVENNTLIIE